MSDDGPSILTKKTAYIATTAIYILTCITLIMSYGHTIFSPDAAGGFFTINVVITISAILGIVWLFVKGALAKLALVFSTLPLVLISTVELVRSLQLNGSVIGESGEVYAMSFPEILVPSAIIIVCIAILSQNWTKN